LTLERPEDTKVVDMRSQGGVNDVDDQTFMKISFYAFDRPVYYHGFDPMPDEIPEGFLLRRGTSCMGDTVSNVLLVGLESMHWYLENLPSSDHS
jgi:hypothetical protein